MAAKAIASGKGRECSHRNRAPAQSDHNTSAAGVFSRGAPLNGAFDMQKHTVRLEATCRI